MTTPTIETVLSTVPPTALSVDTNHGTIKVWLVKTSDSSDNVIIRYYPDDKNKSVWIDFDTGSLDGRDIGRRVSIEDHLRSFVDYLRQNKNFLGFCQEGKKTLGPDNEGRVLRKSSKGYLHLSLEDEGGYILTGTIGAEDPKVKQQVETRLRISHLQYELARLLNVLGVLHAGDDFLSSYESLPPFREDLKRMFDLTLEEALEHRDELEFTKLHLEREYAEALLNLNKIKNILSEFRDYPNF